MIYALDEKSRLGVYIDKYFAIYVVYFAKDGSFRRTNR